MHIMMKPMIKISVILLFISLHLSANAQFGFGVRGGGNLSSGNAQAFSSSKRIGYQFGIDLLYSFNKNIAISVEPVYNRTRLRMDDHAANDFSGVSAGTRVFKYVNVPVYLKLNITRGLAVLGGADFNYLLNNDDYHLNNGETAFRPYPRVGYSLGIDLGALYFRYKRYGKNNRMEERWDPAIEQYQLGFKIRLF